MQKLDLHRVRHEEARRLIIRFIESNWGSGEEGEIITGNSQKMKAIVREALKEYALRCQEGRQFDLYNTGYLVTWFE